MGDNFFSPEQPSATKRSYGNELASNLRAQRQLFPGLLEAESQFGPGLRGLSLTNANQLLFGTPESTTPTPAGWYDESGTLVSTGPANRYSPQQAKKNKLTYRTGGTTTTAAAPGLLAISRNMDPQTAALWDKLTSQAQSDLDLGADLDPGLMRLAQQTVRSRYTGNLGALGPAGDFKEALGVSAFANNLRNQRRAFAGGVAGANEARRNALFGQALGISGTGGGNFNPESAYAGNIYNSNAGYAAQFAEPSTMGKLGQVQNHIAGDVAIAGGIAGMI